LRGIPFSLVGRNASNVKQLWFYIPALVDRWFTTGNLDCDVFRPNVAASLEKESVSLLTGGTADTVQYGDLHLARCRPMYRPLGHPARKLFQTCF